MIFCGANRRHESSQVFVQMYFTAIDLIHRRFKTRFLDSWPHHPLAAMFLARLTSNPVDVSPNSLLRSNLKMSDPKSWLVPSARTDSDPFTHFCYQLVKELTGFWPARNYSIVHYSKEKTKRALDCFGVPRRANSATSCCWNVPLDWNREFPFKRGRGQAKEQYFPGHQEGHLHCRRCDGEVGTGRR